MTIRSKADPTLIRDADLYCVARVVEGKKAGTEFIRISAEDQLRLKAYVGLVESAYTGAGPGVAV